jgi:flagellar biosynthetic protein FliR
MILTGVMPNLYQFPEGQIVAFVLVLLRIIAFLIAWPIFGTSLVAAPVKILLALTIALTMFPVVHFDNVQYLKFSEEIIFLSVRETCIGLALGFMMRMFFFAVAIAGEIISISMGLASAQLFNPSMGTQTNVIEQFQNILATIFFLAINGHHLFIAGLGKSFELLPVSAIGLNYKAFTSFAIASQEVILMGLKMSAPVLVAIFLANLSMGILGKAVPQINVLVTSFSVTIILGFAVMILMLPFSVHEMNNLMNQMAEHFFKMMRTL